MSDLVSGGWMPAHLDPTQSTQGIGFSSSALSVPTYLPPMTSYGDAPSATTITDGMTGTVMPIFASFLNGLAFGGGAALSGGTGPYTGGGGQIVGYDRYGNPLFQVVDPRTGAVTTTTSPAYPGGPAPIAAPERVPVSYQTGGVWGWLTNPLSLPAPAPAAYIGAVPPVGSSYGQVSQPQPTGTNGNQVLMFAVVAAIAYVLIRAVKD